MESYSFNTVNSNRYMYNSNVKLSLSPIASPLHVTVVMETDICILVM